MSYLDRIAECNGHDLSGFVPFEIGGTRAGWLRPVFADRLARWGDVFEVGRDRVRLRGDRPAQTIL